MTLTQLFTNIANAIRSKKGTSGTIVAEDFPQEILSIDYNSKILTDTDKSANKVNEIYRYITKIKELDLTNIITCKNMFRNCVSLESVQFKNTTNITNTSSMFYNCVSLIAAPLFDTSNVTDMGNMFNFTRNLENVPIYNTSSATNFSGFFAGCNKLTDQSLDNILQMCIGANSYTGTKTLSALSLGNVPDIATRVPTLPHYQAFLDAGWTIGIS